MDSGRHILRLLLAAIVMVAAYLLPSAASAHDGHAGHGARQTYDMRQSDGIDAASSVVAVLAPSSMAGPSVAVLTPDSAQPCSPRFSGCGVMGCCGAAAILSSSAGLPTRHGHAVVLTAATPPTPSGIDPEALPEPPRSRA